MQIRLLACEAFGRWYEKRRKVVSDLQTRPLVREIFGHFANLNLLALLEDLRHGQIAKGDWSSNQSLCPVAHGMEDGEAVRQLRAATQAINLEAACRFAARRLLAYPHSVYDFVRWWDSLGDIRWLLSELEQLWADRLADADTVQGILEPVARPVAMPETIAR
jgi:hypothetical protein